MDSLELSCSNKTLVEPELACNMWEEVRLFFLLSSFYFASFQLECIAVVCSCPSHHHPSSCFWLLSRVCEHFHLQSTHSALNKISARVGGEADRLSPFRAGFKPKSKRRPLIPVGKEEREEGRKEKNSRQHNYYCYFSTTRATRRKHHHHSTATQPLPGKDNTTSCTTTTLPLLLSILSNCYHPLPRACG